MNNAPFVALSLGWGVQSWTLAAMSALGELPPLDAAIHADTTHERQATYEFAQEWTPWLEERAVKVVAVKNEDKDGNRIVIDRARVQIPAYTILDGKKGMIRRQCTGSWKIRPVRRWLQRNRNRRPVELWLGISTDEFQRARDADVKYITHKFPLLELGMSRADCLQWLESKGLPSPGKSSCVFCPYLNKSSWESMRRSNPEDWQRAIEADTAIRSIRPPGELFLHGKRIPLEQAVEQHFDKYTEIELLASDDDDAECDSGHCFL